MTPLRRAARASALALLTWASGACSVAAHERNDATVDHAPVARQSLKDVGPSELAPPATEHPIAVAKRGSPLPATATTPPRDARREACGSLSQRLSPGSGEPRPDDDDRVILEYAMFAASGQQLDSSTMHGEPLADSVRNLGPGLPCVVKGMSVGESRRVWVGAALQPPNGEGPRSVPARDLVFDITLRQLIRAPQRPKDYASPPRAAQHTPSGLRYQVLRRGSGNRYPFANSRVTISHSGWTNRGVLFASSALAGEPATFVANELPTGLSEGIRLMRVGDKLRFWLPEHLAYESARKTVPKGPLVFDVELLAID